MTLEQLAAVVEKQQAVIDDQKRRIERMEAVNAIQNVMSKYAAYHVASEQEIFTTSGRASSTTSSTA